MDEISDSLELKSLRERLENMTVIFGKGLETDKVTEQSTIGKKWLLNSRGCEQEKKTLKF